MRKRLFLLPLPVILVSIVVLFGLLQRASQREDLARLTLSCAELEAQSALMLSMRVNILATNGYTSLYSADSLYTLLLESDKENYPVPPKKIASFRRIKREISATYLRNNRALNGVYFFLDEGGAISFSDRYDVARDAKRERYFLEPPLLGYSAFRVETPLESLHSFAPKGVLVLDYNDNLFYKLRLLQEEHTAIVVSYIGADVYSVGGVALPPLFSLESTVTVNDFTVRYLSSLHTLPNAQLAFFGMLSVYSLYLVISLLISTRIQRARDQNAMLTLSLKLSALESQIDSHFLYNTLECVHAMAYLEGNAGVASVTKSLAEMIRYLSKSSTALVPMLEEVAFLSHYRTIQSTRMGEKLRLRVDIPEVCMDVLSIRMLLQPIVENCLRHGAVPCRQLQILVRARIVGEEIEIGIFDNGCGMSRQRADEVLSGVDSKAGIGTRNIMDRLRLQYGARAKLSISSVENHYTAVHIRFPVLRR